MFSKPDRPYRTLANSMSFHEWVTICIAIRPDEVESPNVLIERAEAYWIGRKNMFGPGSFARSSAEYALELLHGLRERFGS